MKKAFVILTIVCMVALVCGQVYVNEKSFEDFMNSDKATRLNGKEDVSELFHKLVLRVSDWAHDILKRPPKFAEIMEMFGHRSSGLRTPTRVGREAQKLWEADRPKSADRGFITLGKQAAGWGFNPYPFYSFIPIYLDSVVAGGSAVNFSSPCFQENMVLASELYEKDGKLTTDIKFTASKPSSTFCADNYFLGTYTGFLMKTFFLQGEHFFQFQLPEDASEAEIWAVKNNGIRIMRFLHNPLETLYDILATTSLFLEPLFLTADRNLYFLETYTHLQPVMHKRKTTEVFINESLIQSGDLFGIQRLDGSDPTMTWAMGTTIGHTAIALRIPDEKGELYIAESSGKDWFWPTKGIQMHKYDEWIQTAKASGLNVVYAPLSPTYRSKFNTTKVLDYFKTVEGFDFGYHTLLWAWIDTVNNNYPCLPPDFKNCFQWENFELVFAWIDRVAPSIGRLLFNQGLNKRLNSTDLRAPDLFKKASESGLGGGKLPMLVEQDSWKYNISRKGQLDYGQAHIASTFVCRMWKEAGIFAEIKNNINCQEFTNWDVYSLKIFDTNKIGQKRPKECIDADPDNQLCQLLGGYSVYLNDFNSKSMTAHMAEKCSTKAPDYHRESKC